MKSSALRLVLEVIAWIVANVLCTVAATGAVFLLGTQVLNWNPARLSFYLGAMTIASLTWGSWAALIWTKTRVLRAGMRGSTILPGLIIVGIGASGAYVGIGALVLWLGIMLSGFAMMVVAVGLSKTVGTQATPNTSVGLGLGIIGFPALTTAIALGVGSMWYQFVNNSFQGDWRSLVSFAAVMVTILAMALVSSVIPSLVSSLFQRIGSQLSD